MPSSGTSGLTYFNSRPSARGDASNLVLKHHNFRFQFTPLREGRLQGIGTHRKDCDFNSRPSARGDLRAEQARIRAQKLFQFTPLREGRPVFRRWYNSSLPFQFTPLREGRHRASERAESRQISIHAPPRGATGDRPLVVYVTGLFQFTPLREGRHVTGYNTRNSNQFQFTPLREGRQHGKME